MYVLMIDFTAFNRYPAGTGGDYHQYNTMPAYTSVQSDLVPYCWLTNLKNIMISLKMIMDNSKNGKIKKTHLDHRPHKHLRTSIIIILQ